MALLIFIDSRDGSGRMRRLLLLLAEEEMGEMGVIFLALCTRWPSRWETVC
jgi:hypothetical protein